MMSNQRTLLKSKQRPLLMSKQRPLQMSNRRRRLKRKQLRLILSSLPRDPPDSLRQQTLWSSCPLTTSIIARLTPDLDTLLIPDLHLLLDPLLELDIEVTLLLIDQQHPTLPHLVLQSDWDTTTHLLFLVPRRSTSHSYTDYSETWNTTENTVFNTAFSL